MAILIATRMWSNQLMHSLMGIPNDMVTLETSSIISNHVNDLLNVCLSDATFRYLIKRSKTYIYESICMWMFIAILYIVDQILWLYYNLFIFFSVDGHIVCSKRIFFSFCNYLSLVYWWIADCYKVKQYPINKSAENTSLEIAKFHY